MADDILVPEAQGRTSPIRSPPANGQRLRINPQPNFTRENELQIVEEGSCFRAYGVFPLVYTFFHVISQKIHAYWCNEPAVYDNRCILSISHPNILDTLSMVQNGDEITGLLSEKTSGRTLERTFLSPEDDRLPVLTPALECALQITRAVYHLHADCVIHGQLGPDVVYLDDPMTFGFKLCLTPQPFFRFHRNRVYTAPEFRGPQILENERRVSFEGDVYGLGCIIYRLLMDQEPVEDMSDIPLRDDLPESLVAVLRKCWQLPIERPTVEHLLRALRDLPQLQRQL